MLQTKKRATALLAAVGVAAAIGVGGFAYAAFTQERASNAIAAEAEAFENLVVTGAPLDGSLWPGQKTDVTLTIDNKANDTPILITKATHIDVAAIDVKTANPDDADACAKMLKLADFDKLPPADAAISSGAVESVKLADALQLDPDAGDKCQGMKFTVKWKVSAKTTYGS
jgi:hypothetical protein